jgi:hypothetical protein
MFLRISTVTAATTLAVTVAMAQPAPTPVMPAAAPVAGASPTAGAKTYAQQDLDQLLAPIALYPESLLAQVLMASTYPLDVVEAARWAKANPSVKDKALEDAIAWTAATMEKDGLANVKREKVMVPHWVRGAESLELVAPRRQLLPMLGLLLFAGAWGGHALLVRLRARAAAKG